MITIGSVMIGSIRKTTRQALTAYATGDCAKTSTELRMMAIIRAGSETKTDKNKRAKVMVAFHSSVLVKGPEADCACNAFLIFLALWKSLAYKKTGKIVSGKTTVEV